MSGDVAGRTSSWQRRKDHRHAEILAAALECLEAGGGEDASVAAIGRRAGVSEGTVYKYFGSKDELMAAVVEAWMGPVTTELKVELEATVTLEARLFILARRHLAEMRRKPRLHELVYRQWRWTNYRGSAFHRHNQAYAGLFRSALEEADRQGALEPGLDIPMCRDIFYGGLEHLGTRTVLAGREIDLDETARAYVATLLRGWAARREPAQPDHAERLENALAALERLIARQSRP
nr:TetR/AcrR family transcriptional regulator [Aliihoeflea sp. 40Bstr573]